MNNNIPEFGSKKGLDLRDIWKDEARNFTPWLADNLKYLSDELGAELECQVTEANVGGFSLDILAKDLGTNKNVIIENQLTPTDHDHLGKLITYASGYNAYIAVWIAESFREEHRQALDWLNQRTDIDTQFFGVVPEVFQIDDSKPTVQFNLIVFPNDWQKEHENPSEQPSEKRKKYKEFFQRIIDELRTKHHFTNARKGQYQNWYSFSSGYPGLGYNISFATGNRIRVELYFGSGKRDFNKNVFDFLMEDKEEIEKILGYELSWERLDDKMACRICIYKDGSIDSEEKEVDTMLNWSIEYILKFKQVFHSRLGTAIDEIRE